MWDKRASKRVEAEVDFNLLEKKGMIDM